jgi:ornithine cyclodeaminase/alanine dehydrogenase-like protein (mu-crystallin family)
VGTDAESKRELSPELLAGARTVVDVLTQCAAFGDLHHALAAGAMTTSDVYAELGDIVAGQKPGRQSDDEVIVFDSTGMALQDAAAAALVLERALQRGRGQRVRFTD